MADGLGGSLAYLVIGASSLVHPATRPRLRWFVLAPTGPAAVSRNQSDNTR